ncbi:hypothetical protein ON010_g13724 [Phytophthora cinnamomi]|nr:hypothetical protein ON010_g13724 [Phytophthora cinnamomi]
MAMDLANTSPSSAPCARSCGGLAAPGDGQVGRGHDVGSAGHHHGHEGYGVHHEPAAAQADRDRPKRARRWSRRRRGDTIDDVMDADDGKEEEIVG